MWASNKQDDSEEVAKRTFLELEKHKNEIEETKASIEKYQASRDNSKTVIDVKDLLAQGEEVSPQAKPAKITKSRKKKADSDSEIEDWEEVHGMSEWIFHNTSSNVNACIFHRDTCIIVYYEYSIVVTTSVISLLELIC